MHDETISAELERSCAGEQIHLLGSVQPYGFLMVADVRTARIVQVSSGIQRYWPGMQDGAALIGAPLVDWVDGVDLTDAGPQLTPLLKAYPAPLALRLRFERSMPTGAVAPDWECLGHVHGDLAILEWFPGEGSEAENMQRSRLFVDLTQAIGRLRHAQTLDVFYDQCTRMVQQFCGFDRVMIYRFLPDGSGEVVAEQTANGHSPRFCGLRFPASDIPSQARLLYLRNRLRVLADVDAEPDTLIPPTLPDGTPLDQSFCMLRGMSELHLSYLRNMGVRATLVLSIVFDDRLWGLIACHHHQSRLPPHHIRESLRQACELIAEVTNMRIETLNQMAAVQQRLVRDQMLHRLHQALILDGDIATVLAAQLPALLAQFGANGFGLRLGNVNYVGGSGCRMGSNQDILDAVATRLDPTSRSPKVRMWDDLRAQPERALDCLPDAAGLLLAQRWDDETVFCFMTREEVVQQVRWGGEPTKGQVPLPDGRVRLEPRRSFEEWRQDVKGKSSAWEQADADALALLLQALAEVHRLQINRVLHEKLHWRAHHDQLTGLFNRRAMEDEASKFLAEGDFDAALLLLDLDHFKKINDTYGHGAGDLVLQQLSQRLGGVIRDFDLLARLGGDEFMLLLHVGHPEHSRVLDLAERLHEIVQPPFFIAGHAVRVGISVGIAIPPEHGTTVGELLRRADLALYHAKAKGRSRSVVFEMSMESDQLDYYLLERDLAEAVICDQLSLVYQPKVDLVRGTVIGLEALVRWNHPTRGLSLPGVFIPVAERSDQIIHIDRWVMRTAIAAHAHWRLQGLQTLPIAINLSMADILSTNLLGYLSDQLQTHAVHADALEIEVTESCMMRELQKTQSVLLSLNQQGISTTLDDFGTGFSSLSYLRQLPLQCIKIDQSFTQNMLQDPNAEKLTQAILAMGSALTMRVVAEGVETAEQMQWLLRHGCEIGQGYYFSQPVAPDAVHATITAIESRMAQRLPQIATQAPL